MEGPRTPGYYASVTGVRPPGERPGRRGLPGPGEPLRGPVALYGEVHRYGPGQQRLYLVKFLLGLNMDIERVWKGTEHPVPSLDAAEGMDEHLRITAICMAEAETVAASFNRRNPTARRRKT